ncbi:hypothetical protein tinsulaeT_19260 [Thalassotalea insulae]|uniref:DUF2867 domain-containing protein n=1 Tax=Thalassotalea insulae TaxID=2056778 RepID=A0ABQ6GVB4_9GAMM|nr:hypothetical protein [Thalassotalea insulae]GLX78586.1 hypothetical protein tinsulaeT_19260 [Thalassotalea insulae]
MTTICIDLLPENALSIKYAHQGAHTDCYYIDIPKKVTLTQYIEAFYTTPVFKIEHIILSIFAKKHVSNNDISALANGNSNQFSIWTVEDKSNNQILLCEFTKSTRSWLMTASLEHLNQPVTRLYFGSVVVPRTVSSSGKSTFGILFHVFSGFHKLYSRALLKSAFNALVKHK